jgi:hypothetical protein
MAEVDRDEECPATKGTVGLRKAVCPSIPKEEERRDMDSKWPERFSLRVLVRAKPESLRHIGVDGIGGKIPEFGEREEGGLC